MSTTEWLGRTDALRVGIKTVNAGEKAAWHYHTAIVDTVVALTGAVVVEMRQPEETVSLAPGQLVSIPCGRPHRVGNGAATEARFLLIQGVGAYDFNRAD